MRRRRPTYRKPWKMPKWSWWALTFIWWGLLLTLILTVNPVSMRDVIFTGMYFPLLLLVFLALSGTLFLIRKKFWLSLYWGLGVSIFLVLRIYGWGNVISLITIGLCLTTLEFYWKYLEADERRKQMTNTLIQEEKLVG